MKNPPKQPKHPNKPPTAELRSRAEQKVAVRTASQDSGAPAVAQLIHELEVHQVELEMQNEELRRATRESELVLHRYTELFDFAPIGYVVLDARWRIREANLAAAAMLAMPRINLPGQFFAVFVADKYIGSMSALLRSMFATRDESSKSEEIDVVLAVKQGQPPRHVRIVASRLIGNEPQALVAMIDVTALKRTKAALREESKRKDAFLAALSHELRNPLVPIRSGISLLKWVEPDGEQARKAMATIERQVDHLTRIVDDLLDVTRIAQAKVGLRPERLALGDLVRSTVDDHRPDFEAREIAFEVRLDPGPFWVDVDPTRLTQVIDNLFGNAAKFTGRGGRVEVGLRHDGGLVALSVRDSGSGIAPEMLDRVFEPFVQAPQTLERKLGGLGLGLAMVKGLVELHGGTVQAASAGPGCGSEFTVRLPLAPPAEAKAPSTAPAAKSPRRRVLVIEDNVDAAEMLREVLMLEGHEVRAAYDGRTGIELARGFHPEIIFCDIGLPEMSGYDVARAIRADDALRNTYLVALSGYARGEDRERSADAGFDAHLAKPPPIEALERVIAEPSFGRRPFVRSVLVRAADQ